MPTKPVCDCWFECMSDGCGIDKGDFYRPTGGSHTNVRKWDEMDLFCPICGKEAEDASQ